MIYFCLKTKQNDQLLFLKLFLFENNFPIYYME